MLRRLSSEVGSSLSTAFFRKSFVYLAGNVANGGALPMLLMPVLTRYLTPLDYGILGTSTMLVQFLAVAVGLNSSGLIVGSEFDNDRQAQQRLVSTNVLLAVVLAGSLVLLTAASGGLVETLTKFPGSWAPVVVVLALGAVIQAIYLNLLQARNEAGLFVGLQTFNTLSNLGLSVVLVVGMGMGWQGRMLAILASGIFVAAVSLHGLVKRLNVLRPAFDRGALSSLLSFGIPLIPHVLGGWVMTMSPRLYLNHLATVADTGLYSVAFNIASPIALVAGAANQAYMPALFDRLSRRDSLDKLHLSRVLLLGAGTLLAAALAYGLAAPWLLVVLVGPRFYPAADYVLWLALAMAMQGVYFIFGNFVVYSKRTALIAWRADFLAGLAVLALTPVLMRWNGPIGAAQSAFLGFAISCVGCFTASRKAYPMPWGDAALSIARFDGGWRVKPVVTPESSR